MGYYTTYELSAEDSSVQEDVERRAREISGYSSLEDSCKWYDHDEHMLALSKEFPTITLRLDGEGEETGDVWAKWYRNGEMIGAWKAPAIAPPAGFVPPNAALSALSEGAP